MFGYTWPSGAAANTNSSREAFAPSGQYPIEGPHVVVEGLSDGAIPDHEPRVETAIATEDDFVDDCPPCEMMRERVRNGERIEIVKLKYD